ncbi:flavin reductase family protein [Salipiger bermudensis]|uniref:flavin reductase family protein n=1 Tax=Salipiger bermudensis TaxID=344736 RepID=UPI001CD373F7|nr:flavin reductase family protein [Salipiger bermudensis]MCA1283881.1 flavin reductase family protein [Salipiger bermudensis]
MTDLDPTSLSAAEQYRLLSSIVVPRPIAFVVTQGPAGWNAAPFSFFTMLGVAPPTLIFSAGPRDGGEKDTICNLRDLPECVVHIVPEALASRMNACAASLPREQSEVAEQGFALKPSVAVAPPRLAEFPVQLECRVAQFLDIGMRPHVAVVAEVLQVHAHDGLIGPDLCCDGDRLGAIGRISGQGHYARLTDTFQMKQPG